jgi:hypothetical protein
VRWLALAFALLTATAAHAGGPGKALFEAGRRAYREGRFEEASRAFLAAYDLDRLPELLFNVALSEGRAATIEARPERLRAALSAYERYLAEAPHGAHREEAARSASELKEWLGRLEPPPVRDSVTPAPKRDATSATPLEPWTEGANTTTTPPRANAPSNPYDNPPVAWPPPPLVTPAPALQLNPPPPSSVPPAAPRDRRWVTRLVVTSVVAGATALAVGLGVGLTQSSAPPSTMGATLGTINYR